MAKTTFIATFKGNIKNFKKYMNLLMNAEDKIVCVDIDNTLFDVNRALLGAPAEEYPAPGIDESFWVSEEGKKTLLSAKPIKETFGIVSALEFAGAQIVYATARPKDLRDITMWQLVKYGLDPKELMFVSDKKIVEADVYLEDSPHEIKNLLKVNSIVLIPEQKYNRGFNEKNIIYYGISL